jgi:nucleoside-diphosphate-sugar epimerase
LSSPSPPNLPPFDVLIHLAAQVDFERALEPTLYRVNTVATLHLASAARERNAYFILASTVSVHGADQAYLDEHSPIRPMTHYAMSKYLAEEAVKSHGGPYSLLRLNGIYGLDGPSHLGLNRALSGAFHRREKPVLRGPGKSRRNYICVIDVARWIEHLVKRYEGSSHKSLGPAETIYLAGPEVISIEEYLTQVAAALLPGEDILRREGAESGDIIVKAAPSPFELLTFRRYLHDLGTAGGHQER